MLDRPATYSRIESFAQQKNISLFIALNGINRIASDAEEIIDKDNAVSFFAIYMRCIYNGS